MSLLQDLTENGIPKDVDMPCGICPEGIADKAFPPDSPARRRYFYATVRFTENVLWKVKAAGEVELIKSKETGFWISDKLQTRLLIEAGETV